MPSVYRGSIANSPRFFRGSFCHPSSSSRAGVWGHTEPLAREAGGRGWPLAEHVTCGLFRWQELLRRVTRAKAHGKSWGSCSPPRVQGEKERVRRTEDRKVLEEHTGPECTQEPSAHLPIHRGAARDAFCPRAVRRWLWRRRRRCKHHPKPPRHPPDHGNEAAT